MIVEYVRYRIEEAAADTFVAAYARAAVALAASPTCLAFELTRAETDPCLFMLRIEWTSAEGHLEGFRKGPTFDAFLAEVRAYVPAIESMTHFVHTPVRSAQASSIYGEVGGVETFFRLARAMHARMKSDPVLGARFGRASASHVPHLAMWLTEVFGGPQLYTETLGDIGEMLARHAGLDITEDERSRFVERACEAAAEVFPEHARDALAPFRRYVEWGSHVAVTNSRRGHVADPSAGVPRWHRDDA